MTPEQFLARLRQQAAELRVLSESTLPVKVGNEATNFFKDNFVKGGFVDGGVQAWIPAKRLSSKYGDKRNKTLLSDRNHLQSEIKYYPGVGSVSIKNEVPYAKAHNEGTTTAGKNHNITIPKRQFIGDSHELNQLIKDIVDREIKKIMG